MHTSKELKERLDLLKNTVNTLTIQCLASGIIPKIKTGQEISHETLYHLRNEIEDYIANNESKNDEEEDTQKKPKKAKKLLKKRKIVAEPEKEDTNTNSEE